MARKKDYSIEYLDSILLDKNKDLKDFNYLFEEPIQYKVKKTLPKRKNSTVKFIQYEGVPYEMALKEMDDITEVGQKQPIDISPRVSKIISNKFGKRYSENLLKYYGNDTLTKNIAKKLDGDFSTCAGIEQGDCVMNGKKLSPGRERVKPLSSQYPKLFSALTDLHEAGFAHKDIKFDNIFKDKDKIVIADYDKACRNSNLKDRKYFDIKSCDYRDNDKTEHAIAYMPKQFLFDRYYWNEYDLYQLAITFYEIITNQSFIKLDEIKDLLNDPSITIDTINQFYQEKYQKLLNELTPIYNQMDKSDEEGKSLIQFIIDFANPDFDYSEGNRTEIAKTCRNDKKHDICESCYETKNKYNGKEDILPSYCDRIIYNYSSFSSATNKPLIQSVDPLEYNSYYLKDDKYDSDHNLVYAKLKIEFEKDQGGAIFSDSKYEKQAKILKSLNIIYFTLNQGEGIGNGSNEQQLNDLIDLIKDQDIIIFGVQEIQPQSKKDYLSSQKTIPLIENLNIKMNRYYKQVYSKIYGLVKRRTGLFIFIKQGIQLSDPTSFEKCLVSRPEKLCNKSIIGTTIQIKTNLSPPRPLHLNIYDTHLSFSQKSKDFGFSKRKEQLQNIVGMMVDKSKNQKDYINILGGDLNFRVTDSKETPESLITSLANQISKTNNFIEPFGPSNTFSFPPSCKFKTRKSISKAEAKIKEAEEKVKAKEAESKAKEAKVKAKEAKSKVKPLKVQKIQSPPKLSETNYEAIEAPLGGYEKTPSQNVKPTNYQAFRAQSPEIVKQTPQLGEQYAKLKIKIN